MSIKDRPWVGTWALNNRGVVRHTPDALVYINGALEIAGCPTCGGRIDIQRYITAVTVDSSVETSPNTASITMHIPRSEGHSFVRDGQFVLKAGLEINIYFRGYFPMKGLLAGTQPETTGGVDVQNAVMYPYYHVFHGVVTEVGYEYAGGEHTASLSCADILHFWQYQLFSTSRSFMGKSPGGSKLNFDLFGNALHGMSPYGIIYTLYTIGHGSIGGIEGTHGGQTTNQTAMAENDISAFSMASLYWEKRFADNFATLRMHGTTGTLYNGLQQSFLAGLSTQNGEKLIKMFSDPSRKEGGSDPILGPLYTVARSLKFDFAGTFMSPESVDDAKAGGFGFNILEMQAFKTDYSAMNINMYESEYETKMDVASRVCQLTNFEFYQDVDGDFVFKPPFYNLDTSSNQVYVIKDIDLISISFTEAEPEVTALKATKDFGGNTGFGAPSEIGSRATYVDYRLVAQFGWREQTFETAYAGSPDAMFYACVSRMDLYNLDMRRAQCQIPIRPELRAGYPVYLEPFDCFYYLKSFSHSLSYGGQCTTNLTLTGRRVKFYAPGYAPEDGSEATVEAIDLSNPWLPPLPLTLEGDDGVPRLQGFPNVVMALNSELLNPEDFTVGEDLAEITTEAGIQQLILKARLAQVLETDEEGAEGKSAKEKWLDGPFLLRTGRDVTIKIGSASDLLSQAQAYQQAYAEANPDAKTGETVLTSDLAVEGSTAVLAVIDVVGARKGRGIEDETRIANILDTLSNLKDNFTNAGTTGLYRYYSSAHPEAEQQGMREIIANAETTGTTATAGLILLESPTNVFGFKNGKDAGAEMGDIQVTAGIPILRPNTGDTSVRAVPTPTHQITSLSFGQLFENREIAIPKITTSRQHNYPKKTIVEVVLPQVKERAKVYDDGNTVEQRFLDMYKVYEAAVLAIPAEIRLAAKPSELPAFAAVVAEDKANKKPYQRLGVDPQLTVGVQFTSEPAGVVKISVRLANTVAETVAAMFREYFVLLVGGVGKPGKPLTPADAADNAKAYADLDKAWVDFILSLVDDEQPSSPVGDKADGVVIQTQGFAENPRYFPVFPVSDGRGYEVVGVLAYGRGLTIEETGNLGRIQEEEVQGSVAANEERLAQDQVVSDVSVAFGKLIDLSKADNDEAATSAGYLAAAVGVTLEQAQKDPTLFQRAFSNYVASSKERSQKLTTTNAAYGLSDLGLDSTRSVCSCKGAEADVLLMAYGDQNFVSVDQPEEVTKWLADQALVARDPWEQVQEALRGQILDVNTTTYAERFQKAKGQFLTGVNADGAINPGVTELTAAGEALKQAGEDIKANFDDTADLQDHSKAWKAFIKDTSNPNLDEPFRGVLDPFRPPEGE
jgi:hypothetical protein